MFFVVSFVSFQPSWELFSTILRATATSYPIIYPRPIPPRTEAKHLNHLAFFLLLPTMKRAEKVLL